MKKNTWKIIITIIIILVILVFIYYISKTDLLQTFIIPKEPSGPSADIITGVGGRI